MSSTNSLDFTPAYELRDLIARRKLSPVELTSHCLDRIEKLNPKLNAFLAITADMALDEARKAEAAVKRGARLGPLHGIPVPIKDIEAVKGVRHTMGSLLYKDNVATRDAIAVVRIRKAGGIIIGKTNTPEWGLSGTNENRLGEPCRNPWDPARTSGGSSGGAGAAVASGMTPIAQGSDGGGSVRIPASLCGIYGIKATQGRVPRWHSGIHSWQPVNFSSVGPMTRNVRDGADFLEVLSGPIKGAEHGTFQSRAPKFTAAMNRGVKGLRVAWSPTLGGHPVDPEIAEIAKRAATVFEDLGAHVEEMEFAPLPAEEMFAAWYRYFALGGWTKHPEAHDRLDLLTDYAREVLENGRDLSAADVFTMYSNIGYMQAYARDFFLKSANGAVAGQLDETGAEYAARRPRTRYDLLLSPTLATAAFKINGHPAVIGGRRSFNRRLGWLMTYVFNVTGNPAATIPCGFTADGMPAGLQLVAAHQDEEAIVAASAAFEAACPWADRRPPAR